MAPTATGSKARWVPQARRKACMGWSWAAACDVHGLEHIVAVARLQLVTVKNCHYFTIITLLHLQINKHFIANLKSCCQDFRFHRCAIVTRVALGPLLSPVTIFRQQPPVHGG